MLPCLDKKPDDSLFSERLGGLQAVQALNEHETRSVGPNEDRCLQALVEKLVAISSARLCSSVVRRFTGT